jgi:hypothetical protein
MLAIHSTAASSPYFFEVFSNALLKTCLKINPSNRWARCSLGCSYAATPPPFNEQELQQTPCSSPTTSPPPPPPPLLISMDITLSRHSIAPHNVGSSHASTFALLKPSKGKPQKAAYGTDDGCLTCFAVKKGQAVVAFRTAPGPSPVTCVHVHVTPDGKDRIFFAVGRCPRARLTHDAAAAQRNAAPTAS